MAGNGVGGKPSGNKIPKRKRERTRNANTNSSQPTDNTGEIDIVLPVEDNKKPELDDVLPVQKKARVMLVVSAGTSSNLNQRNKMLLDKLSDLITNVKVASQVTDKQSDVLESETATNGLFMERFADSFFIWMSNCSKGIKIKFELLAGFNVDLEDLNVKKPLIAFSHGFDSDDNWKDAKETIAELFGYHGASVDCTADADYLYAFTKISGKVELYIYKGYDTTVGQRGAQLSGGQKQRIAIARAILKNPKILLLDEATSALDMESERIVQDALNRIMVGRTTLVVAHRLSTVRNAHCISVVSKGKLVEQGHHDELVKDPNGAYSQLIRLQEKQQENGRMSDARLSGSTSKRRVSLRRSISRSSAGSSRHSLSLPLGVPGPTELMEHNFGQGARQIESTDDKVPNKAPMERLINLNKAEAAVLLFGSIAAAIDGAAFPTLGLALASASKIFYEPPDQRRKDSILWALLCVGLGATVLISRIVNNFLFAITGGKLIEQIRVLTFQSMVHQEVAWFDYPENTSGALNGRLCIDALNVRRLVGDNLALLVQSTATIIGGIVIAMVADWKLSLVILFVIPLVGLQGYAQVNFLRGFSQDAKTMYEEASQVATEAVGSIRTVASFCAEKRVMDRYNQKCQASRDQGIRTGIVGGLGFGFSYMMLYASSALCYYVGAKFVSEGKSTFGDVFKAFFSLFMAMIGVSQTNAMASNSAKANDSAISIFSILDRKSLIDSSSEEGSTL